jgi:protein TonB
MGYRLMHAGLLRDVDDRLAPTFDAVVLTHPTAIAPPARYGENKRPRWFCLSCIIAAHILALWAAVVFNVIDVQAKPKATIVTLLPEEILPPEHPPEAKPETKPAAPPMVAPPPIVQVAQLTPPPITASPVPPPPAPPAPTPAPVSQAPAATPNVPPSPLMSNAASFAYPMEAKLKHWEGVVRLRVLVGLDGRVQEISVLRSSGHEVLDKAALKAVREWRFKPAMRAGNPVEDFGWVDIPFKLTRA